MITIRGIGIIYNQSGVPIPAAPVKVQMVWPQVLPTGVVFPLDIQTYFSDSGGNLVIDLPLGVEFEIFTSRNQRVSFTTPSSLPSSGEFELPGVQGYYGD